jgi:hypothetical protein
MKGGMDSIFNILISDRIYRILRIFFCSFSFSGFQFMLNIGKKINHLPAYAGKRPFMASGGPFRPENDKSGCKENC